LDCRPFPTVTGGGNASVGGGLPNTCSIGCLGSEAHELERLRRSLAMLASGVAASSLSREEAMALVTELVVVQTRLERLRAELRRLVDEADDPSA
jgi:hypothetical protein